MARFLVDEDVAVDVARGLVAEGHDAVTVSDLRRKGTKDDAILWLAARLGRTVISHNARDFDLLHRAWHRWQVRGAHSGIIILRQSVVWRPAAVVQRVLELLSSGSSLERELYTFTSDLTWKRFDTAAAIEDTRGV